MAGRLRRIAVGLGLLCCGCMGARVGDPEPSLRADAARRLDLPPRSSAQDGVWDEREAVSHALAHNPRVQASLARAGVARAELVAALTPENPVLGLGARFPHGGGGVNLEFDLLQEVLSLILRPARDRIARAAYDAERLEIAQEVVEEALEVSEAWYGLVAAGQILAMRGLILEASAASHEVAARMAEAGNLSRLGLAREAAAHAQSESDALQAEAELIDARERLRRALGLAASDEPISVPDRLPEVPASEPDAQLLTDFALRNRPDLAALGRRCEVLCAELGLARGLGPFDEIDVGISSERESEGAWVTGPALEVEVPLFDQGQPRQALLAARLREAWWQAQSLEAEARTEIRALRGRLDVQRRDAGLHAGRLIPAREQVVALSQQEYNFMLLGVDRLLEAKREEFDAYAGYVAAVREYWVLRVRLERAVGARILVSGPGASPTTTERPAASDGREGFGASAEPEPGGDAASREVHEGHTGPETGGGAR